MAGDFPSSILPDEINGWTVAEEVAYNPDNLFDYIDGGAELYLSYNFESLTSRTYTRENQPDIVVDVFDMHHSFNAFGVFSHARETIDRSIGQGSQYTEGLLMFWKDRYFVSILASPETPDARETIHALAKRLDGAIDRTGPLPEILDVLPRDGLVEESIRFFFHHVWLNSEYYIADRNILLINEDTQAVLAAYREDGRRTFVVAVRYKNAADAEAARASFSANYLPEGGGTGSVRIEDGSWSGCRTDGDLLAAVFNAPTQARADALIESVLNNRNRSGGKP